MKTFEEWHKQYGHMLPPNVDDMRQAWNYSSTQLQQQLAEKDKKLEKQEAVIEAAKEVVGWKYDDMGCGYDGCDLSDFGHDVKILDKALSQLEES